MGCRETMKREGGLKLGFFSRLEGSEVESFNESCAANRSIPRNDLISSSNAFGQNGKRREKR
jgi:hypothetical protein